MLSDTLAILHRPKFSTLGTYRVKLTETGISSVLLCRGFKVDERLVLVIYSGRLFHLIEVRYTIILFRVRHIQSPIEHPKDKFRRT
jgi:hypothetical protein